MKISIITVAYNSEDCIGQTIESVLAQDYEDIEYLIVDGASEDGTVAKAREYEEAFAAKGVDYRIYSEPDQGIYDAMNKGIRLATGDVIGMINSGDWYEHGAVSIAAKTFQETGCELLFGDIRIFTQGRLCYEKRARQRRFYQTSRDWNHPTMFVKSKLYKQFPFPNLGIHDDYGFYLQMRKQKRSIYVVNQVLANFQMGGASNQKNLKEAQKRIWDRYRYCYRVNGYSRWYLAECILTETAKWILG